MIDAADAPQDKQDAASKPLTGAAADAPPAASSREDELVRMISESGLLDARWYAARHPDAVESGLSPALHYLRVGAAKGYPPSPAFDGARYLADYPDIARAGANPLVHYAMFGKKEGRSIKPAAAPAEAAEPPVPTAQEAPNLGLIVGSGMFDGEWYASRHPEVATSGLGPALHYLRHGGAKGWAPSPGFDGADYLARYPDVGAANVNPLVHFLLVGRKEGRQAKPADAGEVLARQIQKSGLFDADWYKATYPEAARSRLPALDYYLKNGRKKGHNPGPKFDAAAYIAANPDVAASTINPLAHYLSFGRAEGRAIVAVDASAEPARKERARATARTAPASGPPAAKPAAAREAAATAQPPSPGIDRADIALIEASPLFDRTWYLSKHPEAARQGMGAAEHYLRHGASDLRQPSLLFDAQYYVIEQSPEIQQRGINPLLHYLKTGRAQGRKPRALFEALGTADPLKPLNPADWPLAATGEAQPAEPIWQRHAELAAAVPDGSLLAGETLLAASVPPHLLAAARDRIEVFRGLCGLDGPSDVAVLRGGGREPLPSEAFDPTRYTGLGPHLSDGPARLADAWFAAGRTLRLRFGRDDAKTAARLVVRAFQCAPGQPQPMLAGEALLGAAPPSFADIDLTDPLMPLLLVVADPDGTTLDIGLLPFPSLCRGGLHHAELVGARQLADPMACLFATSDHLAREVMAGHLGQPRLVGSIRIAAAHASGNEPVFAAGFAAWADRIFGVALTADDGAGHHTPGTRHLVRSLAGHAPLRAAGRIDGCRLDLPGDAVPTIAALAAAVTAMPAPGIHIGSFLVADALTARPRLAVHLPDDAEGLLPLQPDWAPAAFPRLTAPSDGAASPAARQALPPLAIRFAGPPETNRAAQLMPLAPDAGVPVIPGAAAGGAIDLVVRSTDPQRLKTLLPSLLRQHGITIGAVRVELAGPGDPAAVQSLLDSLLAGSGDVITVPRHRPVGLHSSIAGSNNEATLVVDDSVVLHDPRTLSALLAALRSGRTASAGCTVLREVNAGRGTAIAFESGGYFPSHVSLIAAPRLILSLPDVRGALPNATYPVVANDAALLLLANEALAVIGGVEPDAAAQGDTLGFSLAALAQGYRHLCVAAVRAASVGPPPPREAADPPGIAGFTPATWQSILESVAVVRELY